MAKNFGKAGNASTFEKVGKKAAEKAQVAVIQNISVADLIDNPENGEDISDTADLELSIQENGFTDPLEVTDFGMEHGKYMILSGHRRRAAGVRTGMVIFPSIVRHFENKNDMVNYMLLSNSQRDSAKDPFLLVRRYKMHEQYLVDSGFVGNRREEIARRLGFSVQQADRYNMMNKVIFPVWDLVSAENVGMSSVLPMASHSETEQGEIYEIMREALSDGVTLTRDVMKKLIDGYREGKRTWSEINGVQGGYKFPLNGFMNTDSGRSRAVEQESDRNDEVRREHDFIAEEADRTDEARTEWEKEHNKQQEKESSTDDKGKEIVEKQPAKTDEDEMKKADDIMKNLQRLEKDLAEIYHCKDIDAGQEMLGAMEKVASALIGEMFNLSEEYGWKANFQHIRDTLDSYR